MNWAIDLGQNVVYFFFYFWIWRPFCSVEQNDLAIVVEGHPINVPVELF